MSLEVPGGVDLPGGWHLQAESAVDLHEAQRQASTNTDPYRAWIDVQDTPAVIYDPYPLSRGINSNPWEWMGTL